MIKKQDVFHFIFSFILVQSFVFAQECSTEYQSIVVGAGAAGMQTGTKLAQSGIRVLIIEKEETFGGKLRLLASLRPNGEKKMINVGGKTVAPEAYSEELKSAADAAKVLFKFSCEVISVEKMEEKKYKVICAENPQTKHCYEASSVVVSTGKEQTQFAGLDERKLGLQDKIRENVVDICPTCMVGDDITKEKIFIGPGKEENLKFSGAQYKSVFDMAKTFKAVAPPVTLVLTDVGGEVTYTDAEKAQLEEFKKAGHKIVFAESADSFKEGVVEDGIQKYNLSLSKVSKIYNGTEEEAVPTGGTLSLKTKGLSVVAAEERGHTEFLSDSNLKDAAGANGFLFIDHDNKGLEVVGDARDEGDESDGGFAKAQKDAQTIGQDLLMDYSKDTKQEYYVLQQMRRIDFENKNFFNFNQCSTKLALSWNAVEIYCADFFKIQTDPNNPENNDAYKLLEDPKAKACLNVLNRASKCRGELSVFELNPINIGKWPKCCDPYMNLEKKLFGFEQCNYTQGAALQNKETFKDLYEKLSILAISSQ